MPAKLSGDDRRGSRSGQERNTPRHLLLVEERERNRIASGLHDGVGQLLAAALMELDQIRERIEGEDDRAAVMECRKLVERAWQDVRSLTFELSPPILKEQGLAASIRALGQELERTAGIQVDFNSAVPEIPVQVEEAASIYRMVRELLHNVEKHARATAVRLEVGATEGHFWVEVEDDGVGFEAARLNSSGPGFGLFSVRERLAMLGGSTDVHSIPGDGTRVRIVVPLENQTETGDGEEVA